MAFKRNGRWFTDYYDHNQTPPKRVRHLIRGARNKFDADQAEKKEQADLLRKQLGLLSEEVPDHLFTDFGKNVYVPWADSHLKQPASAKCTAKAWADLDCLKGKHLREISKFDIDRAKLARAAEKTFNGETRRKSSVNQELITVSGLFTLAMEHKIIKENPVHGVEPFDVVKSPPRYLVGDEWERLQESLKQSPPYLLAYTTILLGTGLREMEGARMKRSDLDFVRGLIFPRDTKSRTDPRRIKGVPMSKEVRETLLAWLESPYCGKDYLFPSLLNPNRHIPKDTLYIHFRHAVERAGIPDFTIHKLRHTFGTNLAAENVPLHDIKELMGHSKIETTLIYTHSSLASKRAAVEHAIPQAKVIHAEEKFTKAG